MFIGREDSMEFKNEQIYKLKSKCVNNITHREL